MNQEDYPSDSDASDEDFRPDKEDADTGSELDSNDEEPEECSELVEGKSNGGSAKRKRKTNPASRKRTKAEESKLKAHEKAHQSDDEKDEELDEEEEKRRTDALWADFLGGGGSSDSSSAKTTKQANGSTSVRTSKPSVEVKKPATEVKSTPTAKAPEKEKPTVAQLFEFAGEQIVLTEDGDSKLLGNGEAGKTSTQASVMTTSAPKPTIPARSSGGLGAVLNQLSKKNKLSTLEKTKLDWTSFKRQEGIEEELQTHNKGKDGFLERRDFLERTDLRQFEIEKTFRQTKRSNR